MIRMTIAFCSLAIILSTAPLMAADPAPAAPAIAPQSAPVSIPAPVIVPPPAAEPAIIAAPVVVPSPAAPAVKIGYADLIKIGTESTPGKAAKARFDAKANKLKGQIAAKEKQLEKQKKSLEEKLPTMPQEQRVAKAKEFEKKVDEYRKFVQKAQQEIEPLQQELSTAMYGIMEAAAAEYGKEKGLAAIIPKKEILFSGATVELLDVTEDLTKLINARDAAKKK